MKDFSRETRNADRQIQQLVQYCTALGVTLEKQQSKQFSSYLEELLVWNKRMNLISRRDTDNVALHHFLDSLSLLPYIEIPNRASVIDIGAGAGFPGLPLKICRPDILLTLVESTRKRALFLQHMHKRLDVSNVKIVQSRAEDLNRKEEYQNQYDFALVRALSRLKDLVLMCLPFLKPGGLFVAYKGGNVEDEVREALPELPRLFGRLEKRVEILLPLSHKKRQLIVFKKVS